MPDKRVRYHSNFTLKIVPESQDNNNSRNSLNIYTQATIVYANDQHHSNLLLFTQYSGIATSCSKQSTNKHIWDLVANIHLDIQLLSCN